MKLRIVSRLLAGLFGAFGAAIFLAQSAAFPFSQGWIVAVTLGPLVGWLIESARTGSSRPWLAGLWFPIFYFTMTTAIYLSDKFYPESSGAFAAAFSLGFFASFAVNAAIHQRVNSTGTLITDKAKKLGTVYRLFAGLFGVIGAANLILSAWLPFSQAWIVAVTLGPLVGWLIESARTGNSRPWLAGLWFPIFYFTMATSIYISGKFYPDSSNALVAAVIVALIASLVACVELYRRFNPHFADTNESSSTKPELVEFRIPSESVLKYLGIKGVGFVVGLMLTPVLIIGYFSKSYEFLGFVGFFLFFGFFALWFGQELTRSHVFISMGPDGFYGRGSTNRLLSFSWNDDLLVDSATISHHSGILIRRRSASFMRDTLHSIFVPQAVFMQREFKEAVNRFAPQEHPLRGISRY
jgi:F0F1-type ATP synthase assembly protein I